MAIRDSINGLFEILGALFMLLNIFKLCRDRQVRGLHWGAQIFFSVWGAWNMYFYPHLQQYVSFAGSVFLTAANVFYILLWLLLSLPVGTRSVLIGAHCFFLHPWFVAAAWRKLYGFPWDPRLWVAFFVHDIGYWGKSNMDGPEGEQHPTVGAKIMYLLFDQMHDGHGFHLHDWRWKLDGAHGEWHDFVLCHSRYFAKRLGKPYSRLCVADKLAFCCTPAWLYLPMVRLTGEIREYVANARSSESGHFRAGDYSTSHEEWHRVLRIYMLRWVSVHKDGAEDTWTSTNRHSGVASLRESNEFQG